MPTFQELWKAVTEAGLLYMIAVMGVFLGAFFAYTWIKKWGKVPMETPQVEGATDQDKDYYDSVMRDLNTHPFFSSLRYAVKYRIPHLNILEPCRRLMFRDLLMVKFTVFLENVQLFVDKYSIDEMEIEQFHDTMIAIVSSSIAEYERKMRDMGIPQIVIERFGYWHQNTVDLIVELIENTSTSRFYANNSARMVAVLDWLQAAFQITLLDAEKTLSNLNGELDGLVYKGVKAHCKDGTRCEVCDKTLPVQPRGMLHP